MTYFTDVAAAKTFDVTAAKTSELVEFYNAWAAKPVKKFADRKTAERRVKDVIDGLPEPVAELEAQEYQLDLVTEDAPVAKPTKAKAYVAPAMLSSKCAACRIDYIDNGYDDSTYAPKILCLACGCDAATGESIQDRPKNQNRSTGVAASWKDPSIAAKRAQRHAVRVDGHEFRSVAAAFRALALPMKEHIKFRMQLKAAGQMKAYGLNWEVFEA